MLSHVVMPCIRLCEQNVGEGCVWFKCRYGPRESDRRDAFSEEGRLQCDVKFATFARHTRKISFSQVQQPTPPLTDQHKSRSCKHTQSCCFAAQAPHLLPEGALHDALLQHQQT